MRYEKLIFASASLTSLKWGTLRVLRGTCGDLPPALKTRVSYSALAADLAARAGLRRTGVAAAAAALAFFGAASFEKAGAGFQGTTEDVCLT